MFRTYSAHFTIVVWAILNFCYANEVKIEVIQVDKNQKYCLIQVQLCDHDLHPLCKKLDKAYEKQNAEHIEFLDLIETDKSNFLIEINTFRDKLASGQIKGYKAGSNFQLVKWSLEFAELAEANYLYNSFCNKISLNNSEFVDEIEFLDEKNIGSNFYKSAIKEKINDSHGNSIWNALFRAEFNRIGCVLASDTLDNLYTFFCYTNRNGPENDDFSFENAYKLGTPCSECGLGKCDMRFRNLCGDIATEKSGGFERDLIDYGDTNHDEEDYHLILYLIIGSVILVLAIVIGSIFLYIIFVTDNSGETYIINQNRQIRDDLFKE